MPRGFHRCEGLGCPSTASAASAPPTPVRVKPPPNRIDITLPKANPFGFTGYAAWGSMRGASRDRDHDAPKTAGLQTMVSAGAAPSTTEQVALEEETTE
ncbi:hypothetical protein THAOC_01865, partial [Thalassiosira oceanica]